MATTVYHGWIIREEGGGFKDSFYVEYNEGDDRKRHLMGCGESGAALAVEWWDKKIAETFGEHFSVKLLPLLKGSYRVYTVVE